MLVLTTLLGLVAYFAKLRNDDLTLTVRMLEAKIRELELEVTRLKTDHGHSAARVEEVLTEIKELRREFSAAVAALLTKKE